MGKPKFRKNPETGRLEKLINGKYTPQTKSFWKGEGGGARFARMITGIPSDKQIKKAQESGKRYKANNKKNESNNKNQSKTSEKEKNRYNPLRIIKDTIRNVNYEKNRRRKLEVKNDSTKSKTQSNSKSNSKSTVSDHAKTGHTKLVKDKDGQVRRVKISDATKDKTLKGSDTSKMKGVKQDDGGRADWLKKTSNSPAAKAGFSDDHRWGLHQKDQAYQKARKEGTLGDWEKKYEPDREAKYKNKRKSGTHGKPLPSNPKLKTQTTKDKRNPNRHAVQIKPKDLPKDKVKMTDGSIVDRSSLYEKKKKKDVQLGTRLSQMFDN